MKKYIKIFCFLLLFMIMPKVSFAISVDLSASTCTTNQTTGIETCNIVLNITGGTANYNKIKIPYELTNLTYVDATASSDWTFDGNSSNILTFTKKEGNSLSGVYEIGTVRFQKVALASTCNVKFTSPSFDIVRRSCTVINGIYYNKSGNIIDELTYKKECEKPTCYEYPDGTYSNKAGNIVDKSTYEKECKSHTCEIIDGTYFGISGNIVNEITYKKECEKLACYAYPDGTYSNKAGNIVDEITYKKECEKLACYEYPDGTYSNKAGNIVDKNTYEKECKSHVCEIIDGTYFGKTGSIVDYLTYKKDCTVNKCIILDDGTIYGPDGNEVTRDVYDSECGDKIYCQEVDDKFYGPDGNIINESDFDKLCRKHFCEVIDGTYFGKSGEVVDKGTYDKMCGEVIPENPKTGAGVCLIIIASSLVISGGMIYISNRRSNIFKI